MSKASIGLLFASLVVGGPTSSHAEPTTGGSVADSLAIAVTSLNKMRVLANACGRSKAADTIAQSFISLVSLRSGLTVVEVTKIVQDAYDISPETAEIPRGCDMKYVTFWAEAFRERTNELEEVLIRYRQHR